MAIMYYLWARFENKVVYKALDKDTCKKAGVSERTMRRYIKRLEKSSLCRRMRAKRQGSSMHYVLASKRSLIGSGYEEVSRTRTTKAQCTMIITPSMLPRDILRLIERKIFEHLNAQARFEKQRRHDAGTNTGATKISTGEVRMYERHPSTHAVKAPSTYYVPMPSDAYAAKMGLSKRGFWRLVAHMDEHPDFHRVRRRVKLDNVIDPVAFRQRWGIAPFQDKGGWWWGQLPNSYACLFNYSKTRSGIEN